mgnify:CR=1 FL=1
MEINDFVGIPFVDGGRDMKGADCWGICELFYSRYLNRELPSYKIGAFNYDEISDTMTTEIKTPRWVILDKPEPYCIALMKLGQTNVTVNHAGVILPHNKLLQAYLGTGSIIVDYTSQLWKRIIKFYIKPATDE